MKKKSIYILVMIMVVVMISSGCQKDSKPESGGGEGNKAGETTYVTSVTAPMGSGWHAVTILLSDIWMNNIDDINISVLEGGSVGNIKAINESVDANFGWCYTPDLIDAYKGMGVFDKEHNDVKIVGAMYPVWLNVVTLDKSNIKTMADLKTAKINAGAIGTGSEVAVQRLLESYGLTYDIIKENGGTVSFGNYADAATQLKDGIVDVMMGGGAPDIPAVHEVEAQQKVRLIPADEKELNDLFDKAYGYSINLPIPADTYQNQPEEVTALTYPSLMVANKDLPDDVIYEMTKVLWENIEKVREEQPARGNYMRIETVFDGIDTDDLHPGAAKYYKEIGILD